MKILLRSRIFQKLESEDLIDSLIAGEVDEIRIPTWSPYEGRMLAEHIRHIALRSFVLIKTRQEQACLVVRLAE